MKALVYHGPGKRAWEDRPRPVIQEATDAIVHITTSTICGTDLHILKGDLPAVTDVAFSATKASRHGLEGQRQSRIAGMSSP